MPPHEAFVEHGLQQLETVMSQLLQEDPDAPILFSMAVAIDAGNSCTIELEHAIGSAILRHIRQGSRDWAGSLREKARLAA
jgi:hypothetical protein